MFHPSSVAWVGFLGWGEEGSFGVADGEYGWIDELFADIYLWNAGLGRSLFIRRRRTGDTDFEFGEDGGWFFSAVLLFLSHLLGVYIYFSCWVVSIYGAYCLIGFGGLLCFFWDSWLAC